MTLAEVFLLVLLIVWWGSAAPGDGSYGIERLKATVAELTARMKALEVRAAAADDLALRNEVLEAQLKYIASLLGAERMPSAAADWEEVVKRFSATAKRGFPECRTGGNVLLHARATDMGLELRLSQDAWQPIAEELGIQFPAAMLSPSAVDSRLPEILRAAERFYSSRKSRQRPCRFDYTLEWTSDAGYRTSREALERYFYPAGIQRVGTD